MQVQSTLTRDVRSGDDVTDVGARTLSVLELFDVVVPARQSCLDRNRSNVLERVWVLEHDAVCALVRHILV